MTEKKIHVKLYTSHLCFSSPSFSLVLCYKVLLDIIYALSWPAAPGLVVPPNVYVAMILLTLLIDLHLICEFYLLTNTSNNLCYDQYGAHNEPYKMLMRHLRISNKDYGMTSNPCDANLILIIIYIKQIIIRPI